MVYTNIETNRNFKLHAGIYYSTFKEEVFSPVYNAWSEELLTKEQKKAEKDKIITPKDLADAIELAVKQIQMTQEPVSDPNAPKKNLLVGWTQEIDQDMECFYSMDAEKELLKALNKEKKSSPGK